MRQKLFRAIAIAAAAISLLLATSHQIQANSSAAVALTGQVSAQKEGLMEGVVVGAKKDGSTITVNVTTDEKGRFSFPASKLDPGRYALKIRAAGYDYDGPKALDVVAEKATSTNIKLKPAKDLSAQLSDAEWLLSIPGTEDQKKFLLSCNGCHTIERIVKTNHSAGEWVQVIQRMSLYAPGSSPLRPQMTVGGSQRDRTRGVDPNTIGEWLASVNTSYNSKERFPFKTLPRPKGRATRAIITEYDLPRPLAMPTDVVVDSDGAAW